MKTVVKRIRKTVSCYDIEQHLKLPFKILEIEKSGTGEIKITFEDGVEEAVIQPYLEQIVRLASDGLFEFKVERM